MAGLGWQELVIVLVIIMIIFGAGKLPEVARSLGQGVKEFKTEAGAPIDAASTAAASTATSAAAAGAAGAAAAGDAVEEVVETVTIESAREAAKVRPDEV